MVLPPSGGRSATPSALRSVRSAGPAAGPPADGWTARRQPAPGHAQRFQMLHTARCARLTRDRSLSNIHECSLRVALSRLQAFLLLAFQSGTRECASRSADVARGSRHHPPLDHLRHRPGRVVVVAAANEERRRQSAGASSVRCRTVGTGRTANGGHADGSSHPADRTRPVSSGWARSAVPAVRRRFLLKTGCCVLGFWSRRKRDGNRTPARLSVQNAQRSQHAHATRLTRRSNRSALTPRGSQTRLKR